MDRIHRGMIAFLILLVAPLEAQQRTTQEIAAATSPAVVVVIALAGGQTISQGSGFFVTPNGHLVTNRHVLDGAEALQVRLPTGEIYDNVYFVAEDERRDLVVLQIPVTDVPSLDLGDERDTAVGDPVFVMGSPRGLEGTFSNGIVSAKRTLAGVAMLQITAPISPGSSGGPVLDSRGIAIGVATLTLENAQNLNMAVPARYVSGLLALAAEPQPFRALASRFATEPARSMSAPLGTSDTELEPWAQVLLDEMRVVQDIATSVGYVATHDPVMDMLDEGDIDVVEFVFDQRGANITIAAVCDIDCREVDLAIFDPSGIAVAKNVEMSNRPVLQFSVLRPGRFRVHVYMARCGVEPCGYAVLAYEEPNR